VDQVLSNGRENGDLLWTLTDHQGSVRDIIDASGNPLDRITYSAFGERINETAPATSFLFGYTGAVFDIETGLGYHRARYLDHATGRWLSQDPIGFRAGDANLYRYVGNSPTNFTDPSGLISPADHPKWPPDPNYPGPLGPRVYDAAKSALSQPSLLFGTDFRDGDTIINSAEAGTIKVRSGNMEYADKDYKVGACVLKRLGFPLPSSENGVYWGQWTDASLHGTTILWVGLGGDDLNYSFISTNYRGASAAPDNRFLEFIVTLYHEVKGHNIDEAMHLNPAQQAAFDAAYEAPIYNAAKNGALEKAWKCCKGN
jgi:RHS repeat-associated protein